MHLLVESQAGAVGIGPSGGREEDPRAAGRGPSLPKLPLASEGTTKWTFILYNISGIICIFTFVYIVVVGYNAYLNLPKVCYYGHILVLK